MRLALIAIIALLATSVRAAEVQMKHEYATVNGVKLHYVSAGKGKLVLFLHGFPEFWYEWKNQLPAFAAKGYHAVAPDMRGYNLSDKPANVSDYAIPHLIADVAALIEHLSPHKKAILVGHDWGGVVAWATALAHPELLEKLVIIDAPHPAIFMRELANNPAQQRASAYMNMFKSEGAEKMMSAGNYAMLVRGVLGSTSRPDVFTEEDKKAYIEAWSQPGALTGGLNYYRASNIGPPAHGTDVKANDEKLLAQIPSLQVRVPTLVIWGEKDTALLTGNLDGMDKYVADLKIIRIPDGSHWVIHEEPEVVNSDILEFIAK